MTTLNTIDTLDFFRLFEPLFELRVGRVSGVGREDKIRL